ncbi:MAG: hypothetical protein PHE03_10575, partial [Bacteroidales bacterium]|nr:hypothetical protein [Bacteroidales bacterium]
MWFKIVVILFFVSLIANDFAFAQEISAPKDSTLLYKKIETYSDRSKFTRFMYHLFFKPVAPNLQQKEKSKIRIQRPYSTFEGEIIRNIKIETLDPFKNSIEDTITSSGNFIIRAGNKIHIKTRT